MRVTLPFVKGHGAGNDFVVIPDLEGRWDLSPEAVVRICDRHVGLGADGILRVTRAGGGYFMDYRNADGSLAETCGNGLRVFARYLVESGLEHRGRFTVHTRAGEVPVHVAPDDTDFADVAVHLGIPSAESEPTVHVVTDGGHFTGTPVHMPNPHCVCVVDSIASAGSLLQAPVIDPLSAFPEGANVEFVERRGPTHIVMRTFERGVGETLACGSGACAAAHVWAQRELLPAGWSVQVDVLGGTVHVDSDIDGSVTLRGPAVFVAKGEMLVDI